MQATGVAPLCAVGGPQTRLGGCDCLCRAFVTSLLLPGHPPTQRGAPDALEVIIRLARAISTQVWPPRQRSSQSRPFGRASVLASPDFLRFPQMFGLARTLALPGLGL
jgi:hypothetical protein